MPTMITTLAASLSLLVPMVAATTAPVCVSSDMGYATGQVNYLYNNFCQKLANSGFGSDLAMYGLPVISLSYTSAGESASSCDQNNCLANFKTLVGGCGLANETIWGTGSLSNTCGTYNFTIWDTDKTPVLGAAATTLIGATMTTAATIQTATRTSTSSSSASVSSTSSEPTLILESSISSTITTSSSSVEPSDLTTSSSFLPTVPNYANSTTIAVATTSASAQQSAATNASGTTTGSTKASATKIDVGSTALGSGADVVKVGGLSLVAVACVFAGFL